VEWKTPNFTGFEFASTRILPTDYGYESVPKESFNRVEAAKYSNRIKDFTARKKRIEMNLIPVTVRR
jgi:hypothetical protein